MNNPIKKLNNKSKPESPNKKYKNLNTRSMQFEEPLNQYHF